MSLTNPPCTTCGTGPSPTDVGTPQPLGDALFQSRLSDLLYRLASEQARPDENNQRKVAAGLERKDGKTKVHIVDAAKQSVIDAYNLDVYTIADETDPFSLVTPHPGAAASYTTTDDGQFSNDSSMLRLALSRLLDEV